MGGADDVSFVVWEDRLAKGLADIAGLCNSLHLRCGSNKEAEFEWGHNWGEAISV